jgi:uncharacterized protein YjbI with pentapeptide repeats
MPNKRKSTGSGGPHRAHTASLSPADSSAPNAADLRGVRDSVVDAAGVSNGLWLSYLLVLFYLLIAVAAVTHQDLFLESSVKLPFLNVELPLVGFFWLGPTIFLVLHVYVLLHFTLFAAKVGAFDVQLRAQVHASDERLALRRQLPINLFVQMLAGPREIRTGLIGFLLRVIAQISLVGGPVLLLIFFQLQFLPYHDSTVSWWQRILVIADVALLWTLWPSIAKGKLILHAPRALSRRVVTTWGIVSLLPILVVLTIATFPGELLDSNPVTIRFIPTKMPRWSTNADASHRSSAGHTAFSGWLHFEESVRGLFASVKSMGWASLHTWLVAGDVDLRTRKPRSPFSNRLVLPAFDALAGPRFDSEAKINGVSETVSLRRRDLRGAVLIDAVLRKADFTAANLKDAYLDRADLRDSKFDCARSKLNVNGLNDDAGDTRTDCAQLQGASLLSARLQGATLREAQLQEANLSFAELQGANLSGAQLVGAALSSAHMQGATLERAWLQGAHLDGAWFDGADLRGAHLQGAILSGAFLRGARLDDAWLQGAVLDHTYWQDASLNKVYVWRSTPPALDAMAGANVGDIETSAVRPCSPAEMATSCSWSFDNYTALRDFAVATLVSNSAALVGYGTNNRTDTIARIDTRLNPNIAFADEQESTHAWTAIRQLAPAATEYQAALAKRWIAIGCLASAAPYVIAGMVVQLEGRATITLTGVPFAKGSAQRQVLAQAFLDDDKCPGNRGLSEENRRKLISIRDAADSASPSGSKNP